MLPRLLAQQSGQHLYGFEGTSAQSIFIVGFAGLLILGILTTRISFRMWMLAAVLFITSLAGAVSADATEYRATWMLPIQVRRPEIHLGLGVVLSLMLLASGGLARRLFNPQMVIVLLMALYAAAIDFLHPNVEPMDSVQAIGFALATIPAVGLTAAMVADSYEACLRLLRMMIGVSALWTFCASVQFIINPEQLVSHQGRFVGLLGNAQHAATYVAPMAVVSLWLMVHDPARRAKLFWATMIGVNLLFLIWSGSRTGGVMLVLGSMAVMFSRMGKAVALLPVAAIIAWGLAMLADALQIGSNLERFVNLENTRSYAWGLMIQAAWEDPLIGSGFAGAGASENSYLVSFAAFGIIHFLLTVSLALISAWHCWVLWRVRRHVAQEYRALIDMFVAFCAMYFVGALFEGYMHARSYCPQIMLLIFAAIGAWLRQAVAGADVWTEHDESPADEYFYEEQEGSALARE